MADVIPAPLVWDAVGTRVYETGVSEGVLYPRGDDGSYLSGEAWNGLIGVTESPSGAEASPIYANNKVYLNLRTAEDYGSKIEAYTYPDGFAPCIGAKEVAPGVVARQQEHKTFGMSYRTILGNDTQGDAHGFKIHLVYGASAAPAEKNNTTTNNEKSAITMSWEVKTEPIAITAVAGITPTACLEIDSTKTDPAKMQTLLEALHGTATVAAHLPSPDEIITMLGVTQPAG